jgi:hypothetical protein
MTQQELFDATIQAFLIDKKPFGYDKDDDQCRYMANNGTRCAIGIHLDDETARRFDASLHNSALREDYQRVFGDLDVWFANRIQDAHDLGARHGRTKMAERLYQVAYIWELDTTLLDVAVAAKMEEAR